MRDSNPISTGMKLVKYKKDAQIYASLPRLTTMAGRESLNWHPLVENFVILGKKLEQLGFIYHKHGVIILKEVLDV